MTRGVYILLLRLHPRAFRQRFGDEMLGIFDDSSERSALMMDGVLSLFRQWTLRRREIGLPVTVAADGVPLFYSGQPEVPRASTWIPGAILTLFFFGTICFAMSHRWQQSGLIVGSHHPSPSNILPVHTAAQTVEDLPAEVKLKPYPEHVPASAYFRFLLVLSALDTD